MSLSITHHSGPLDTEAQGTHPTQVSDEHYRVISMNSKGKKLEIFLIPSVLIRGRVMERTWALERKEMGFGPGFAPF